MGVLAFPSDENSIIYDTNLVNSKFNVCKFYNGTSGNFMLQFMKYVLGKYADFAFTCPLKKGNFTISKFPVDIPHIPGILPSTKFKFFYALKALVPGKKSMIEIYSVQVFWKHVKGWLCEKLVSTDLIIQFLNKSFETPQILS